MGASQLNMRLYPCSRTEEIGKSPFRTGRWWLAIMTYPEEQVRARVIGPLALLVVIGLIWHVQSPVQACGPGFVRAVFDDVQKPDTSWSQAVRGDLGILRPGLPVDHLVIAYRHLVGLPVDADAWDPTETETVPRPSEPYEPRSRKWQALVIRVLGPKAAKPLDTERTTGNYEWFANVSDHAFEVALDTWRSRSQAYGEKNTDVLKWLEAQDQVFRSNPGAPRIPELVSSPEWLCKDSAYQRAAALFYADRWDEAREAFRAVSKDAHSPWRAWGAFLVGRCWIRQASLGPEGQAGSNWAEAKRELESVLREPAFSPVHETAGDYLEYVRYRLEPEVLQAEALEGLVAPRSGPAHLEQLIQTDRRMRSMAVAKVPAKLSPAAEDLQAWLGVMKDRNPSKELIAAKWKSSCNLPWLLAALAVLPTKDPLHKELADEASRLPKNSPAGVSLRWHMTRSAVESASPAHVLPLVRKALQQPWPAWAETALRKEGRAHASTLHDWSTLLGSRIVRLAEYGGDWGGADELPETTAKRYGRNPLLLDPIVTEQLNFQLPLHLWEALIASPDLPPALKTDLAHSAWTRAVLLQNWGSESRLRVCLDPQVQADIPKDLRTLHPAIREFRIVQVLMAFPGLSPIAEGGMGRANDGWAPLSEAVWFGTNWWCLQPKKEPNPVAEVPAFLGPADVSTCESEWGKLRAFSSSRHWFGRVVTAYAETHKDDPTVPQSLHRFVRITRNAECHDKELSELSRRAFRILHKHYPDSPWAKKTPVHY